MNAAVEPPYPAAAAQVPEALGRCYHCAEPVEPFARHEVSFDGERRALCCAGCEAVMRAILDAGLAEYYRRRSAPAAFGVVPEDIAAALDELAVYDEPEFLARHVLPVEGGGSAGEGDEPSGGTLGEVLLSVEGLRCGACVWLLERSLRTLPGVAQASCNYSTARARVRFDTARLPLSAVLARVREVGYRARPFDAREREAALARESRQRLQRLFVAGIGAMQVMMYALPAYLAGPDGIDPAHERLLRWAALVLTTPVMLYSAQPFLAGAWRSLRSLRPNMDVPVSIGLLAAFGASVHATLTMRGEIWFDSVAMFAFLLLGARWLEWQARRRALRALDDLGGALPEIATRLDPRGAAEGERVPAVRLAPGERVRVAGGERVPADARVAEGVRGAVDLSLLSGESAPLAVAGGESVPGGALVVDTPLELIVERGVPASAPSMIERLIERGAAEKPRIVRLADRVAVLFVTVLLLFAAAVFATWWTLEPSRAASVALSVLVVSCPCALSLATPAALAAATGRLLGERLVVTRGHAIETVARVTDVVLDKTGTLTTGRPVLDSHVTGEGADRAATLALAALLERGSGHPFARALREAAAIEGGKRRADSIAPAAPCELRHEAGRGVRAVFADGSVRRLGSAAWCGLAPGVAERWREADGTVSGATDEAAGGAAGGATGGAAGGAAGGSSGRAPGGSRIVPPAAGGGDPASGRATSEVFLVEETGSRDASGGLDARPLARFGFVDPPRPEAAAVIASLRERGLDVHLLSGDRPDVVEQVADELGIGSRRGAATPADKQAAVAALQASGRRVLMVGDGINDAPVLALADVSLAVGEATALTRTAADVISLAPGIAALPSLLGQTRRAVRVVRQNLLWAASYNLLAIPAAAFGLVPPWAAAVGMAASSLLVVGNASRLLARPADEG